MCWESAIKYLFHSLGVFFFVCLYKPSIIMSPKACAVEPNTNVLKQVGEIFSFHVLLRQLVLVKLGKVMLLKYW